MFHLGYRGPRFVELRGERNQGANSDQRNILWWDRMSHPRFDVVGRPLRYSTTEGYR